eukprot:TRINITY_DN16045_c0_g1_i1.p2 TRINITY_DN16045_c0_g1~~TRINITY_DN16045_c0_g1_i1.p2  ORF type:complete len:205 (-),score=45.97 TRINITY_DN16045_c0_g1_i1:58-672(-)
MLEESLTSVFASMFSWFTPTILFVLINVVIGTIAVSSSIGKKGGENEKENLLVRAPSLVLQRFKSLTLNRQRTEELEAIVAAIPDPETETLTETVVEETLEVPPETHFTRSQSESIPASPDLPAKKPEKLKKSASEKLTFGHFEEEEEIVFVRRPETMKETRHVGDDEEVDAKADDFINRFKQQLKLQRLDSIIRYKDMLNRGK